jgi:hypothetical protein
MRVAEPVQTTTKKLGLLFCSRFMLFVYSKPKGISLSSGKTPAVRAEYEREI